MKYKCCNCESIFDGKKAIDGYDAGYEKGFMCPVCGANIQGAPLRLPAFKGKFLIWIFLFVLIPLPVVWKLFIENNLEFRIQNITGYLFLIIAGVFLFLNRKNKQAWVMMTKPVEEDN